MNFNSYEFIFLFFSIVVILFFGISKYRKITGGIFTLAILSLIYYGVSDSKSIGILLGNIVMNYFFYLCLVRMHKKERTYIKKVLMAIFVFINICFLIYIKYYNFVIDNCNLVFGTNIGIKELIIPLGISFVTFQQIAFLVDTYRGETTGYSFVEYVLFISFFPHISSGPIITHKQFFPIIKDERTYNINWKNIACGLYMFAMGLGKKVLIADVLGSAVDVGWANILQLNATSAFFIMVCYSLQIYFDFSGFCDMALGIAKVINIELPNNFNSPYKASNILEFWDRWHITLTKFFTKYLYIPLGGSRKGNVRTMINTMIVFLCSGIWHGASWTFILWGFLHGCAMVGTKIFIDKIQKIPRIVSGLITFGFINITWVLFRAGSFSACKDFLSVVLKGEWSGLSSLVCSEFTNIFGLNISIIPETILPWLFVAVVLAMVFVCKNVQEKVIEMKWGKWQAIWTIIVLVISVLSFSDVTTYIYSGF